MVESILFGDNAAFLEGIVRRYLADPASVDPSWAVFFQGEGRELLDEISPQDGPSFQAQSVFSPPGSPRLAGGIDLDTLRSQGRVFQLINAHRVRGHLQARLDPLGFLERPAHPELDPAYWGFTSGDWDRTFSTATLAGPQQMTLRELLAWLRDTYSRTIGCEFMHIHDVTIKNWLQERFERNRNHVALDVDTQVALYEQLCRAETFENFLHVKYRGAKRFSLEGAEAMIPVLWLLIDECSRLGAEEAVLGMAHRGRLNVLANILGKLPRAIFSEFDDTDPEAMLGRGDVKYHLGYSSDLVSRSGRKMHLSLAFNPSHLESIDPVVQGYVRAKQDRRGGEDRMKAVVPILVHGDAAFAGQGLVAETFSMSGLPAFNSGGTIHLVVNNQIGFTTDPADARTSTYCTAVGKMAQIPIMHVNGEDPEAVAQVGRIAAEFRQTFNRDVIIDMYCFRRYGHNEADEPSFTQPLMYDAIRKHPAVHDVYRKVLVERGLLTDDEARAINARQVEALEAELYAARKNPVKGTSTMAGIWSAYRGGADAQTPRVATAISEDRYDAVIHGLTDLPEGVKVHPKIKRILDKRAKAIAPDMPIDWGLGESLAYGALVLEGHSVRMTGQDCLRGTFSHRHAGLFSPETGECYMPLKHMAPEQGAFEVYNSLLSEFAVVGFEYGYAMGTPDGLVVWEAQFGDFANGAQVMFDQFIAASEDKWERLNATTLLLPHGFEGMGPEHSSARLERFLQLCAEDNMQVVNLTTPAQIFHALRRQVVRPWRKPLVVMTPKSLLRLKQAVSYREDFTNGCFHRVIPDHAAGATPRQGVKRVIACSGKVYYDLINHRSEAGDEATAIIRLEQLYPFPETELLDAISHYGDLQEIVWCQEEPANMGARSFLHPLFTKMFKAYGDGLPVRWVARDASASPATGSPKAHRIEQERLVRAAFQPLA